MELEKNRLDTLKISLSRRQTESEKICQNPDSLKKIEQISAGILHKNLKFVKNFDEVDSTTKKIFQRLNHVKNQLDALKIRLALDKPNTSYKILKNSSNVSVASIIADAILREPEAVQLVARFDGNSLEMDKTWELLSEIEKDEIRHKKIFREL